VRRKAADRLRNEINDGENTTGFAGVSNDSRIFSYDVDGVVYYPSD